MKCVSRLIEDGDSVFIAINIKTIVYYAVYNYALEKLLFVNEEQYIRCERWGFNSTLSEIVAIDSDDSNISLFSSKDGSLIRSKNVSVKKDIVVITFHDDKIRVIGSHLNIYNRELDEVMKKFLKCEAEFDLLNCIIAQGENRYFIYDGLGTRIFTVDKRGLGVMSATSTDEFLALSESKGAIRIFSLKSYEPVSVINPPDGHHATSIAFDKDGNLHSSYITPGRPGPKILTVHSVLGELLNTGTTESGLPLPTYSPYLKGWLYPNLEFYRFEPELKKGRLHKLYQGLDSACIGWQPV